MPTPPAVTAAIVTLSPAHRLLTDGVNDVIDGCAATVIGTLTAQVPMVAV